MYENSKYDYDTLSVKVGRNTRCYLRQLFLNHPYFVELDNNGLEMNLSLFTKCAINYFLEDLFNNNLKSSFDFKFVADSQNKSMLDDTLKTKFAKYIY